MAESVARLTNESYEFCLDLSGGVRLGSLRNRRTGDEYLKDHRYAAYGNPFTVELQLANGCYRFLHSARDFAVREWSQEQEGDRQTLTVHAACDLAPCAVTMRIEVPPEGPVSFWQMELANTGSEALSGRVLFPRFMGVTVGEQLTAQTACAPMQLGGIHRRALDVPHPHFYPGMYIEDGQATYAGPYALPLVDLLDEDGSQGLFVIVLDPELTRCTLSMTTTGQPQAGVVEVGRSLALGPGERVALPRVAVGVHTGNWHVAVDLYREWLDGRHDPRDIPSWFREAVALYGVGGVGGGGGFLAAGPGPEGMTVRYRGPLDTEIASFDELPALLAKARQMGTDIVYLWDYWEGEPETGMPPYWNKGDYVPRSDLGGPEAFRRGVEAVHQAGGRILVYVEGFIVWKNSRLGQTSGRDMALLDGNGVPYEDYANYWSMCPADEAWQRCLTDICVGLVRDMGVDGIFLDSYGGQWNHTCHNRLHSHWPETDIWNRGLSAILARLRAAVRQVKPEAIVMTESTSDLLLPVEDGSCDGSLVWHGTINKGWLLGSPLKYAFPAANIFSNGYSQAQLNQVFAVGGNLAVGPAWEEYADYIRTLVELKRELKDALIYGCMLPPLQAASPDVVATAFGGEQSLVLTIVNTATSQVNTTIYLPATIAQGVWQLALGDEGSSAGPASDGMLPVVLQPGALQVWQRTE